MPYNKQYITYDELLKFILQPNIPDYVRATIVFTYASGSRIGEMLAYNHKKTGLSPGVKRSDFIVKEEEISWRMPIFKRRKTMFKEPFILKEEKILYTFAKYYLNKCQPNDLVIPYKQTQIRNDIRKYMYPYSSKVLRHSRATHLVELYNYNAWDVMKALGHANIDMSIHYVASHQMRSKIKKSLGGESNDNNARLVSNKGGNGPADNREDYGDVANIHPAGNEEA